MQTLEERVAARQSSRSLEDRVAARISSSKTAPTVPAPKLLVSTPHEQQSFQRKAETVSRAAITREQQRKQPTGVAAITAVPEGMEGAFTEPVSKKIAGVSLSDIADRLFPEQTPQKTAPGLEMALASEGVRVGGHSTVYDLARRSAKMAAGIADWMQSPEALAAAAVEAVTLGAATPVVVGLLGAQFATDGGKQAAKGLEDAFGWTRAVSSRRCALPP